MVKEIEKSLKFKGEEVPVEQIEKEFDGLEFRDDGVVIFSAGDVDVKMIDEKRRENILDTSPRTPHFVRMVGDSIPNVVVEGEEGVEEVISRIDEISPVSEMATMYKFSSNEIEIPTWEARFPEVKVQNGFWLRFVHGGVQVYDIENSAPQEALDKTLDMIEALKRREDFPPEKKRGFDTKGG